MKEKLQEIIQVRAGTIAGLSSATDRMNRMAELAAELLIDLESTAALSLTAERDRLRDELAELKAVYAGIGEERRAQYDKLLERIGRWEDGFHEQRVRAERAEAELAECRKELAEKDGYNAGLAAEVRTIRNVLDDLVDALEATADMDEMDGPEYTEASKKLNEAIVNATPHTEKAITQAAIDMAKGAR